MYAEQVIVLPVLLDRDAVGRAHHKFYALKRGQPCGDLDEYDREFVETLIEILALVEQPPAAAASSRSAEGCVHE